jgi:hypothetical protein
LSRVGPWHLCGVLLLICALETRANPSLRIGQSFTGSVAGVDTQAEPADANGAVGPVHFVELINGRFSVYSKTDGKRVQTVDDLAFWSRAGVSVDRALDITDPRLVFDPDAQRWFACCIDFSPDAPRQTRNRFLLAVSDAADPTGSWHGFAFMADPVHGDFADFPTLGVNADGVYLAGDLYTTALGLHVGSTLAVLPKASLLAQPPSTSGLTFLDPLAFNRHGQILQPAVSLGQTGPSESVLAVENMGWDAQAHHTLLLTSVQKGAITNSAALQVTDYALAGGLTQPDGSTNLDSGDARFSAAVRQVNNTLYAAHSVANSGRIALRWYRIDSQQMILLDSGTIADPNLDLSYPCIAANAYGTVVIACNGSGPNSFVSCYAAVGQTENDSLQFGDLMLLKQGLASYQLTDSSGLGRWGDYSAISVDPLDSNRFWTIQTYAVTSSTWATQITELLTGVRLSITATRNGIVISWPATATNAQLQSTLTLPAANGWLPVDQTPIITGAQAAVTLPLSAGAAYYRLVQ